MITELYSTIGKHGQPFLFEVNKVFSSVHRNYDLMNDVMSLGMHNLWKKYFVSRMGPGKNTSLLDVAGGTGMPCDSRSAGRAILIPNLGDVTFEFLRHAKRLYGDDSNVSAMLVDINLNMLQVAVERADEYEAELNGTRQGFHLIYRTSVS